MLLCYNIYTMDFTEVLNLSLRLIGKTAIVWLPVALLFISWHLWIHYIRKSYIMGLDWVLLEIGLPRDVFKSPQAMEVFFTTALYQTGGVGTWFHRYWLGKVPSWHSLEIVSIDGNVKFFIRIERRLRRFVESQLYAQYPQLEIFEREDYVYQVPVHGKDSVWSLWGTEFKLSKPDPYPIKTYIDYGLDKATGSLEENEKIDPITPLIEFFGSLKKGEQMWLQILIRPANWERYDKVKKDPKKDGFFAKQKWVEETKKEIDNILKEAIREIENPDKTKRKEYQLTEGQKFIIAALERAANKYGFDSGMRIIYLAPKENFDPNIIPGVTSVIRQFNSPSMNGFEVEPSTATGFDYPWDDFSGNKSHLLKSSILDAYKKRGYFYSPFRKKPFVLTTEELATIYHFPGRVLETPTLARSESQKSAAPSNLPI